MLENLHIENIAVIRSAELIPGRGFTVLTGETGAGKTVILSSLAAVLGARPRREMIRSGEERAFVSAHFRSVSPQNLAALSTLGIEPDEEGCIELSRSFSLDVDGSVRAQARISGRPVNVAQLREASSLLVGIHGQHENQRLLDAANHLSYLDRYADDEAEYSAYSEKYTSLSALRRRRAALAQGAMENTRRADMLRFQLDEIEAAKLRPGEEDELNSLRERLKNAEKIEKHVSVIYRALYQNERGLSACELISKAETALSGLADVLPQATEMAQRIESCRVELQDVAMTADEFIDRNGEDADKALDRIETRLDLIKKLCRRYGEDTDAVLEYAGKAREELRELESADDTLIELDKQEKSLLAELSVLATSLSAKRRDAAGRLERAVVSELRYLDMLKVRFSVQVTPRTGDDGMPLYEPDGTDSVDFMFSANAGEPLLPLERIASGGELSRVMLAMKTVFADREGTETLVFDEIDSGVSGGTAQKIGQKLREISSCCQVICITHSAQIASLADTHLLIAKKERQGRTETEMRPLDGEERVGEIARILGGTVVTEKQTAAAREMLGL